VNTTRILRRLASLALVPLLAAGCGPDAPPPSGPRTGVYDGSGRLVEGARDRVSPPNVVLLVLDTTRADGIEAVGGLPPAMPALRAFADTCARFTDASTPAAWTAPSVTSILTGLNPSDHGVQGRFQASPLIPAVATLAEYLNSAGYQTAAFTAGGWVSEEMGLAQGFERFTEPWHLGDPQDIALRWLRQTDKNRPFFLLLHTYEAHDPYGAKHPPDGHDDPARIARTQDLVRRLAAAAGTTDGDGSRLYDTLGPAGAKELFLAWRSDPLSRQPLQAQIGREKLAGPVIRYTVEGLPQDPEREATIRHLADRYRRGLEAMDAQFGTFVSKLDHAGLPGRTVVVVCSDHGEAFGEHEILGHGRWLWDELTRGILLVRAPGRLRAGEVRGGCGAVDVVPTVLDLAGLPTPRDLAGRSLLPLALGRATGHPVRAEDFRLDYGTDGIGGEDTVLRVVSVRSDRAKWISTWNPRTRAATETLFDLAADPGERSPLPAADLARFGADFGAEVGRARALVATFPTRTDNEGSGRFSVGD